MVLQLINSPNFIMKSVLLNIMCQSKNSLFHFAFSKDQGHTVYVPLQVSLSQNCILGQRDPLKVIRCDPHNQPVWIPV